MNTIVENNYSRLRLLLLLIPLPLIIAVVAYLYSKHALNIEGYIETQKKYFFLINHELGRSPHLQYNLTQSGDAVIFLSILSVFVGIAPKLWEAFLSGSLVSLVFSNILKNVFAMPRPAAIFNNNSFVIVGEALTGHNCFPSGHATTIFTLLTVLLIGFMPNKLYAKFLWIFLVISAGLFLAFTRVGVGAHYPLDVIGGSIVGYISGVIGILLVQKQSILCECNQKKYSLFFILLFMVFSMLLIYKLIEEPLVIVYFSLVCVLFSLFKMARIYAKS
jgi:membrane-associated phospholipid phosphatase